MTKRVGYILEKVADEGNLRLAVKRSQRGGKAKRSRQIRKVNEDVDGAVAELRRMILSLDFPPHRSRVVNRRTERGKTRRLDDEEYMPWKILSHAIMQVIEPILTPRLIADTSCCVKGRGTMYGAERLRRKMRRDKGLVWFVQTDCKKFYPSISHEWMRRVFRHHFKDERFLKLLDICVLDYDCGDDLAKEIEDERETKRKAAAGHTDRLVYERPDGQPRARRDRPHHDAEVQGEAGAELRRHGDARPEQGGGTPPAEGVRRSRGGEGVGGEENVVLCADSAGEEEEAWQEAAGR